MIANYGHAVGNWVRVVASDYPEGHPHSGRLICAMYGGFDDNLGVDITKLKGARNALNFVAPVICVKSDEGRIKLGRRLSLGLDVKEFDSVQVHQFAPTLQEAGIEDLTIRFKGSQYGGHFQEAGYNAIDFRQVAHCWIKNVEVINSDGSFRLTSSNFCTLENIIISADYPRHPTTSKKSDSNTNGHHGVVISRGGSHMVHGVHVAAPQVHDIGVDNFTSMNVIRNVEGKWVNLDHHRSGPYCNLFTNIDVGDPSRAWSSGGAQGKGSHAAAGNVYWNIRGSTAVGLPPEPNFGANLTFIGVGEAKKPKENPYDWKVECLVPQKLHPADLYEAMFERRLRLSES